MADRARNLQDGVLRSIQDVAKHGRLWTDFSYVVSSGYREKVLTALAPKPKLPTQVSDDTKLRVVHVSRALRELSERGLVECLTPEVKTRGRLYGLTGSGAALLKELRHSSHYAVSATEGETTPHFVPKVRASTVVRFLQYLRTTRSPGDVADAIRSWSVDPEELTDDTWLSVDSWAEFLELVEMKFGDGSYSFIRRLFGEAARMFPTIREQLSKTVPLRALAERAPIVWGKEWNYGRMEVVTGPRSATFRHYDWMPTPAMCALFHGIYEGVLAARGVQGKVTKTRCVRNRAECCEYFVAW